MIDYANVMSRHASFTLIELLIVLVIIGILATLAAPQYEAFILRAQDAEAKMNLPSFAKALEAYYVGTASFPENTSMDNIYNLLGLRLTNSKYWTYNFTSSQETVLVFAVRNTAAPVGTISRYFICYYHNQPVLYQSGIGINGIDIGGNWYKYYVKGILQSNGSTVNLIGWD